MRLVGGPFDGETRSIVDGEWITIFVMFPNPGSSGVHRYKIDWEHEAKDGLHPAAYVVTEGDEEHTDG